MSVASHQNNFATNLTSNTLAGATTTPLNAIPSVDAPFYLALDATDVNSHYEVISVTSKTATNVNHAAASYAHTTAEEVRMVVPAAELDVFVTTTGTETLTNKTLTNPVINYTDTAPSVNVKCRAYLSAAQENLTDTVATKVLLNAESYDVGSDFDTANSRFVAPVAGYYKVEASIYFSGTIANKLYSCLIYVNGSLYAKTVSSNGSDSGGLHGVTCSDIVYCGAGQYIELYAQTNCGANTVDIVHAATNTRMTIHLLSI